MIARILAALRRTDSNEQWACEYASYPNPDQPRLTEEQARWCRQRIAIFAPIDKQATKARQDTDASRLRHYMRTIERTKA